MNLSTRFECVRIPRRFRLVIAMGVVALVGRPGAAQTLTILHNFGATLQDGQGPVGGSLVTDGATLYGTTPAGGTNSSHGTIFSVGTNGADYTVLHQFGATDDGSIPRASLTLLGSTLFGTTTQGGTNNSRGTLFAISTTGSDYVILHEFGATGDGANPGAGLTLVGDTLYGTTRGNGVNSYGILFSIDTNGLNYTVLYPFGSTIANDAEQIYDSLTAVGPRLFGTSREGGTHMDGTVFAIDTNGANYSILYNLGATAADGQNPEAGLTLVGSTLFGTTFYGGHVGHGTVFSIHTNGSGFTNLYQFVVTNYFDAAYPSASLTLLGSTLYGTSYAGGGNGINGTIFTISTNGSHYGILYGFGSAGVNDASEPQAALTLIGSNFYGTSRAGGDFGAGTVFTFTGTPGGGGGGGGGTNNLTGTLSNVKEKCKTKNEVTTCKLGGKLALLNTGNALVPATHVRFFLSADANYDGGVDTLLGEATSKTIKPGKTGKLKLKAVVDASAAGLYVLAVDDSDNVLATAPVP